MFTKLFIFKSIILLLFLLFILLGSFTYFTDYKLANFFNINLLVILPLSIIVHELLHMIGFLLYDFKLEKISFGINKVGIPFTRISKVIPKKYFLIATLMPMVLLGILPLIYSLIIFNKIIVTFSIINISGSSGDILIFLKK